MEVPHYLTNQWTNEKLIGHSCTNYFEMDDGDLARWTLGSLQNRS